MIVLGIDPGLKVTGYGVVEGEKRGLRLVSCGRFDVSSEAPFPKRLHRLYLELGQLIEKHRPGCVAIERPFFAKNAQSALMLGEVVGVAILAAAEKELPVYEYSPQEIKGAVTGYGRAGKKQVQRMVKALLDLVNVPEPLDAADALAVAICHHHAAKIKGLQKGGMNPAPTGGHR
ncbi:MAG: crossover junction endodeoxyribonuclease RuvC [candidate division NC10 bacterium]|nr:crossover junction endodeoxyribonuclease RuvC [candidate division NC10 bacterium]